MESLVVEFLAARGHSRTTQLIRAQWLARLTAALAPWGCASWPQLTRAHLERWHQQLLWQPGPHGRLYSPNTVDQALHSARQFLRWAHAHGHLAADPMQGWVLRRPLVPNPPLLSRDELQRLLGAPGSHPLGLRDRALLELLSLGLTTGSCAALDLADLDRNQATLRCRIGRGRPETLRLTPASREHLERYLLLGRPQLAPQGDAFFVSEQGQRLASPALLERLKLHARAAGLRVTPRQLVRSQQTLRERFLQRRLFPLAEDR